MTEVRLYCYTPEAVKMSHSFTRLSFPPEASKKWGADPLVSWNVGSKNNSWTRLKTPHYNWEVIVRKKSTHTLAISFNSYMVCISCLKINSYSRTINNYINISTANHRRAGACLKPTSRNTAVHWSPTEPWRGYTMPWPWTLSPAWQS